jgi:hypothetical protein
LANIRHISIKLRLKPSDGIQILAKNFSIAIDLEKQLISRLAQLMAVMYIFHGLFEADR